MSLRREITRRVWSIALVVFCGAIPVIAAYLLQRESIRAEFPEYMSIGLLSAIVVAPIAALRHGRLVTLMSSVAVGWIAGLFDQYGFVWLCLVPGWSIRSAAHVPIWGLVFGLWTFLVRSPRRLMLPLLLPIADYCSRCGWESLIQHEILTEQTPYLWAYESLVYTPTILLLVGGIRERPLRSRQAPCGDDSSSAHSRSDNRERQIDGTEVQSTDSVALDAR